jgi:hypothetical protein
MNLTNQPKRKYYHVLGKKTFEELGDGLVRVTDDDGVSGVFRWTGEFVDGDLTECNLHMLIWTGGANLPKVMNYRWPEVPADINRPSGWPEELEELVSHQIGRR